MQKDIKASRQTFKKIYDQVLASNASGKPLKVETALEAVIQLIFHKVSENGKLIFVGNGGSAAIASHMAADFWKNGGVKATAFNDSVLLTCVSNDHGYKYVFEKPIGMFAEHSDILMAISSSGQSENIRRAVNAAKKKGMAVITFTGFKSNNPVRRMGDINFYVPISHYGYVEVIHHSLCHCILDVILKNKNGKTQ